MRIPRLGHVIFTSAGRWQPLKDAVILALRYHDSSPRECTVCLLILRDIITRKEEAWRTAGRAGTGVRHFSSYLSAEINHGTLSAEGGPERRWIQFLDRAAAEGRDVSKECTCMCFGQCFPMLVVNYLPHIYPVGSARHTKVSDSAADNGKCIILSCLATFFPVFAVWSRQKERIPSHHMSILSLPRRIGQRDKTGSWRSSLSPASPPICDLLWTLTSSERTWRTEEACHDEHKPGSGGRLPLIQRFFCKSAVGRSWCSGIRDHLVPASAWRVGVGLTFTSLRIDIAITVCYINAQLKLHRLLYHCRLSCSFILRDRLGTCISVCIVFLFAFNCLFFENCFAPRSAKHCSCICKIIISYT